MRLSLPLAVIFVAISFISSCVKVDILEDPDINDSTYVKKVSVSLDLSETKSGNEGKDRNDICIVIHKDGSFYEEFRPECRLFSIDLPFSDTKDYRYDFYAYVNYGEYVGKSVPFSQEEKGLTSYGELKGISKDDVESIVIQMKHNVNKLTVKSITFDGYSADHFFSKEKYLSIDLFIINASEYIGDEPYYTGEHWHSNNLISSSYYSEPRNIYDNFDALHYYDNEDVKLVIELSSYTIDRTTNIERRYYTEFYSIPIGNKVATTNQHKYVDLVITTKGANSLNKAMSEGGIKIVYSNLMLPSFDDDQIKDVNLGANEPVYVSIYGTDTKFYTAAAWRKLNKDKSEAVGVAVSDGKHSFVMHPTVESSTIPFLSDSSICDDLSIDSKSDGEYNTLEILTDVNEGLINAPAVEYCLNTIFANGKHGYVMSYNEISYAESMMSEINDCMEAIGGVLFDPKNKSYWTSTIQDSNNVYVSDGSLCGMTGLNVVRPVCSLGHTLYKFDIIDTEHTYSYNFQYGMTWKEWMSTTENPYSINKGRVHLNDFVVIKGVTENSLIFPVSYVYETL